MTTPMFRSVLPHEPPLPADTLLGYLLVQGALSPTKLDREAPVDRPSSYDYWAEHRDAFATSLHQQLASVLGDPTCNLVQPTLLLDPTPPYTKFRLFFSSLTAARTAATLLRRLSPSQLCCAQQQSSPYLVATAERPFHVTLLTTQPLPEPSWKRTSPPKFRRLVSRPDVDESVVEAERQTTRFVVLSQLLSSTTTTTSDAIQASIRAAVAPFDTSPGDGVEVFVPVTTNKKPIRSCHVGMRSAKDARAVVDGLQGRTIRLLGPNNNNNDIVMSSAVFVDYAAVTDRSAARGAKDAAFPARGEPTRPQCTSVTAHVDIPGLVLVPNVVTEAEEAALVAILTGPQAPWAPSQRTMTFGTSLKRAVQHYGYVFDYQTANVLRNREVEGADCPPLPGLEHEEEDIASLMSQWVAGGLGWKVLAGVVERTREQAFGDAKKRFPQLNQITVNCYQPGEGIGTHIDTPSAFSDGLLSISLNSGCVMEFRKGDTKKLVYLPRRSLLLMSGDARYSWEHMIVTRKTDTVDGEVLPRGLRVSLTLRTAIDLQGQPLPRVESSRFPPVWGSAIRGNDMGEEDPLATPDCERKHVHAVYDAIATQWHHTRGKRGVLWPGATSFLKQLPRGSIVADVGCGDGKYFPAIWEAGSYVIGTDISEPLLRTALPNKSNEPAGYIVVPASRTVDAARAHLRDRPAIAVADCMNIPLRTNSCDSAICIAVLHHLSTFERRKRCLQELVRIVRPGGLINIQAWAIDQDATSRRKFAANDVFVPFNAQPKYLQIQAQKSPEQTSESKSTADKYSEAFQNADYDENKGLVVFRRYCHLYKRGELEDIVKEVEHAEVTESGFESGNYYIILRVVE